MSWFPDTYSFWFIYSFLYKLALFNVNVWHGTSTPLLVQNFPDLESLVSLYFQINFRIPLSSFIFNSLGISIEVWRINIFSTLCYTLWGWGIALHLLKSSCISLFFSHYIWVVVTASVKGGYWFLHNYFLTGHILLHCLIDQGIFLYSNKDIRDRHLFWIITYLKMSLPIYERLFSWVLKYLFLETWRILTGETSDAGSHLYSFVGSCFPCQDTCRMFIFPCSLSPCN